MYTHEELQVMAKPYLVEKGSSILVTGDGQFFSNTLEGKTYAKNYAFRRKVKVFTATEDLFIESKLLEATGTNPVVTDADVQEADKIKAAKALKDAEKLKSESAKKAQDEAKALKDAEAEELRKSEEVKREALKNQNPENAAKVDPKPDFKRFDTNTGNVGK